MDIQLAKTEQLTLMCLQTEVAGGLEAITESLQQMMPQVQFECTLTRGNWHRLGGIVDKDYQPVTENISFWAENECDGDVEQIIVKHVDSGYFATRIAGKTHYFTAAYGTKAEQFIQLEVEELLQVIDRPLVDKDWFPDSLEEFIDPIDYPRLEQEAVGKAYFRFRRMVDMGRVLVGAKIEPRNQKNLQRFYSDWDSTQAADARHFCTHWIIALREYLDQEGDTRLSAKPVSTFKEQLPELPDEDKLQGSELSQAIHSYDRCLGFPFAWYFMMLTRKATNYSLAQAVLSDQMGAYDYLPVKEVEILRIWEAQPYSV